MSNRVSQVKNHLNPPEIPENLPGPGKGKGVVGQAFQEGKGHLLYKEWQGKYGKIFGFTSYDPFEGGPILRVVLSDPLEVRRVLKENPPKAKVYSHSLILGQGILSTFVPQEWARQRNLLKPAFSLTALREAVPILQGGLKGLMSEFEEHCERGQAFDIHESLSAYAFLVIGHVALGEQDEFLTKRAGPLRDAFATAVQKVVRRIPVQGDGEHQGAEEEIRNFNEETFARFSGCPAAGHGHGKGKESVLSIILGKDESGCPLFNPVQRSDELSTFMFAGHETTAHTMSWAIVELCKNLQFQRKLQAEIDFHLNRLGGVEKLDYQNLFKFEYLSLIINETLRLWPVVANGTSRVLDKEMTVMGVKLPAGTVMDFPHYLIHRDREVWGDDADEFNPERKWHSDSFLPFTISPRDCLGRNFAMIEMRMTLISLFSRFNVRLADPNQTFKGSNFVTLYPESGVWVNLEKRSPAQH